VTTTQPPFRKGALSQKPPNPPPLRQAWLVRGAFADASREQCHVRPERIALEASRRISPALDVPLEQKEPRS
jgi:hypothetical protein